MTARLRREHLETGERAHSRKWTAALNHLREAVKCAGPFSLRPPYARGPAERYKSESAPSRVASRWALIGAQLPCVSAHKGGISYSDDWPHSRGVALWPSAHLHSESPRGECGRVLADEVWPKVAGPRERSRQKSLNWPLAGAHKLAAAAAAALVASSRECHDEAAPTQQCFS